MFKKLILLGIAILLLNGCGVPSKGSGVSSHSSYSEPTPSLVLPEKYLEITYIVADDEIQYFTQTIKVDAERPEMIYQYIKKGYHSDYGVVCTIEDYFYHTDGTFTTKRVRYGFTGEIDIEDDFMGANFHGNGTYKLNEQGRLSEITTYYTAFGYDVTKIYQYPEPDIWDTNFDRLYVYNETENQREIQTTVLLLKNAQGKITTFRNDTIYIGENHSSLKDYPIQSIFYIN